MINIIQSTNSEKFVSDIHNYVLRISNEILKNAVNLNCILTGGQTPTEFYKSFFTLMPKLSSWRFWISDERTNEFGFNEFNFSSIRECFKESGKKIEFNYFDVYAPIDESVKQYSNKIASVNNFDITILGIGEDGHVASLFPGNLNTKEICKNVIISYNSPKPPSTRMSLTYECLNNSDYVLFLIKGNAKKHLLDQIDKNNLPFNLVRGKVETTFFFCEI